MAARYLHIEFVYRSADGRRIRDQIQRALTDFDGVEASRTSIKPRTFGHTDIISYNGLPDHWPLTADETRYQTDEDTIDLADAVAIQYSVSDLQYLLGGADHPLGVDRNEPLRELLDLVVCTYLATDDPPVATYSISPDSPLDLRKPPITAASLARNRLTYLPWLSVFTPAMVAAYGRETLLAAPAWRTVELEDGAVLFVCHDEVPDWDEDCHPVANELDLTPYHEMG